MNEIDKAIERVRARRRELDTQIAGLQKIVEGLEGELRGLEYARDLFPPEEAEPARHNVQGPVMALFSPGRGSWNEDGIVGEVDLPRLSVRKFLGRAVRDGRLACKDGVYTMPRKAHQEAAE